MSRRRLHFRKLLGRTFSYWHKAKRLDVSTQCGGDSARAVATLPGNVSDRKISLVHKWMGKK